MHKDGDLPFTASIFCRDHHPAIDRQRTIHKGPDFGRGKRAELRTHIINGWFVYNFTLHETFLVRFVAHTTIPCFYYVLPNVKLSAYGILNYIILAIRYSTVENGLPSTCSSREAGND